MANFVEDNKIRNWLTQRGVQFEYRENINVCELSPGWNLVNLGRHDGQPVDESLIEKYASAMEGGALFPAPIIARNIGGFEVLDGCQRLSSANLLGQTIFNAYIIQSANPSVRASVRICANSVLNGTAPSQEWTIGKIVEVLYEMYKFSAFDCAQWSGQPVPKIEEEISSRESRAWMAANGIDVTLKPANQKGFQSAFWQLTTAEIRTAGVKQLKRCIADIQKMKANNSEAEGILAEVLDFKMKKHSQIPTQLNSKISEVFERPAIRARMQLDPRSKHPIDNVNRALAAAATSMRAAKKMHADDKQAATMIELLQEMKAMARNMVVREKWAITNDVIA